ncbi:WXG100 family type VII secretion target [Kitasatospora azatica]|uniref:WXG100 family type VII secretion target n=1 Tax=Kitasatospora azatica TaxID=58347 RepID=UPI00056118E5|nr:WXG100 family type VII secretion target [Kitasatospora azatica]
MGDEQAGPGTGFTVNQETLTAAANTLQQAADDLATVSGTLANPAGYTADNYGDYGAVAAAQAFIPAWQDELQVDHDALADLADKVRQSAAAYQVNDGKVAAGFRRGREF